MNKITVSASKKYDVLIGTDLIANMAQHIRSITKATKVAIISDSNVWPLYGQMAENSLTAQNYSCCHYVFPAGEASKNGTTYLEILNFLAEEKLTRTDAVVALGGGVVGDMTGFAAATYLRGIAYIQIPTTLLAMVDSSVGGKTAIDLPAGKNLAGAFYQPNLVLCDLDALNTLPADQFTDGCAEVIKCGILYDKKLFEHLEENGQRFDRKYVVSRCVELKRDVVCDDEFDTGARQKLNLGHTIGHAVEKNSNFALSHGRAVAIGTAIVSKAAVHKKLCSTATYQKITTVLEAFSLPITTVDSAETLYQVALSDKKRSGGTLNLIVPQDIGDCIILPTPISELKAFIEVGL